MKNPIKRMTKIGAGILAFVLIGLILYVANGFVGNPVSSAIAKSAIKKHMESQYPELEYRFVSKVGYNFKDGSYVANIQSLGSEDTRFYVDYHGRGEIRDDYKSQVLEYGQTLQRLEKSYGALLKEEWSNVIGMPIRHLHAMYLTEESNDYMSHLKLDMPLDPLLPIPLSVNLSMATDSMDVQQAGDILMSVHLQTKAKGYPVRQYAMDVEYGEQLFMLYGVRGSQIDEGKLMDILQKAHAAGEYEGVIVRIKGEKT